MALPGVARRSRHRSKRRRLSLPSRPAIQAVRLCRTGGDGHRLPPWFGGKNEKWVPALPLQRQTPHSVRPERRFEHMPSEGAFHRVGPNCAVWPGILTENPYQSPELGPRFGPTLCDFVAKPGAKNQSVVKCRCSTRECSHGSSSHFHALPVCFMWRIMNKIYRGART